MAAKILKFYPPQSGPMRAIRELDFAQAEALIIAFRSKYPALVAAVEKATVAHQRLSEVLQNVPLPPKQVAYLKADKHEKVRTSGKTGKTWPKPKRERW